MSRARRTGYTLIEIMVSVVVMTIGATGILAMQGASVRSNQDAAETSTAINFATTWMERMKRDSRLWTATGLANLTGTTQYLTNVATIPNTWFVPAATAPESAGANFFGFDEPLTGDVRYCVNVRLNVAHAYATSTADAVRVDVLVWWKRSSSNDQAANAATCATALTASQVASVTADDRKLRKHFLSSVVTWRDPTVTFP